MSRKLGVILLAAGRSSRMGQNKLLLTVNGESLVRRTARTLLEADIGPVTVVVGHQSELTRGALADLPVDVIHNEDYASGMLSSLQSGLRALDPDIDGAMIVLADLIFLDPVVLQKLALFFQDQSADDLIAPTFAGQRGHPVILPRAVFEAVRARTETPDKGAQFLFQAHPEKIRQLAFPDPVAAHDVDTPEDLRQAAALDRSRPLVIDRLDLTSAAQEFSHE